MQSGKVLSLLSHSAENARVCLCVFQCDKNVEKHLKEVEWLESCGQDVCQISCCVFLVLSSSAQGPLMLRLYVFACVKENCICVTHEMATIYLFMHFKCVFPPSCCKLFVGLCLVCVCVCNLQPQCQRTWPCWVACGKPPSCAAPSPISFFLAFIHLLHQIPCRPEHTFTPAHFHNHLQRLLYYQEQLCHGLSKQNRSDIRHVHLSKVVCCHGNELHSSRQRMKFVYSCFAKSTGNV